MVRVIVRHPRTTIRSRLEVGMQKGKIATLMSGRLEWYAIQQLQSSLHGQDGHVTAGICAPSIALPPQVDVDRLPRDMAILAMLCSAMT